MTTDDFIRARTPEQKAQRMAEIKAATAEQFASIPYHEVTLTTIAMALGWSRGNLYKYVATKEEIFLGLYEDAFDALLDELERVTVGLSAGDVDAFARAIADASDANGDFLCYERLLSQVIEANVTLERLTEFKRRMIVRLSRLDAVFARCLPEASAKELYDLTHAYRNEAAGLYTMIECGDLVREAMKRAGMEEPALDFSRDLADFLRRLIASYR